MDKRIRIIVGAGLDRSALNVLRPLLEAIAKAKTKIDADLKGLGKSVGTEVKRGVGEATAAMTKFNSTVQGPYRSGARQVGEEARRSGEKVKKLGQVVGTVADGANKKFAALADGAKKLPPALATVAREAERELKKIERAQARAALGLGGPSPEEKARQARRVAYWSVRNFSPVTPTLQMGARIAGDIARGAGVDLNMGSYVSDYVTRQRMATELSNSGYMAPEAGKPITANNIRQDPKALLADASEAANAAAMDPTKAMEGLAAFVAKTGDLQTGREILADLAKTAKATGASLEDMVDAAGDVSANMGDVDNKGERIKAIMLAIAGQGKVGAVEIKDLASQMAKVAAAASMFEGDTGKNIAILGGFAQMARSKGGAASATQAATSVASFANMFSKGARLDAIEKTFGVTTTSSTGARRNPEEILLEAIASASSAKHGGMKNFDATWGRCSWTCAHAP